MKKLKPKNYLPQLLKLLLAFFMCLPMWASSLRAQDQPYAEYDSDSETLTFRYGAKPAGAYDLNEGNATPRWWDDLINSEDPEQHNKINKVVFDASFANARPTSCFMWFDGCSDLTEIEGIENLNTEEVTNMGYMFYGCSSLTSLNVSNFDTQNVTDMSYMFSACSGLKSLNVSHFDTQNVKNMSNMFYSCRSLTSLDVSKFNTQKVENMQAMFSWCKGLHSLNLSKFDTQNVKDMSRMFRRSSALKTIYVSDKFVTTKVSNGSEMFKDCTSLKGAIDYDASKIDPAYANCETGYFTPGCAYAEFDEGTGTLTFKCGLSKPEGAYDLNEGDNAPAWYDQRTKIKKVVFDASFANARPTSCNMWFFCCNNLTEIEGIANLNTEEVTNMKAMFYTCSGLTSLDLSKFDTQNVTNMRSMFVDCSGLTLLDVSNFNTQNVTDMHHMFSRCIGLKSLNVSHFDTQNVKDMNSMFYNCSSLTSLDVSNFNTQNVTDMHHMFSRCIGLKSLNVSHFDTQNVKDMNSMFYNCSSLTSLDVSNFNTQNVTDMHHMFSRCTRLKSLDLSKFDTQNVESMHDMFWDSYALATIYVSDKFVTTKVSSGADMFKDCTSLKGAIDFDGSKTDHTYANYKTGYFTKLVGKNGNDKIGAVGEVLTAESLALADDKDFEAYEPFTAKTATYTRTLKEGTSWATLCLPFNVELEGQNFRAFNLLSATDDIIKLQEVETSIEAGKPVVIKMNEGENTLSFTYSGTTIAPEAQTVQALENSGYKLTGIYTQKVFDKTADNNCFIIKGGSLMNPAMVLSKTSTQTVGTKPFRAYMQENGTESGARAFSLSFEGEATSINTLNGVDADNAEYYDLQGCRINSLQKGINIIKHGGKATKILIR